MLKKIFASFTSCDRFNKTISLTKLKSANTSSASERAKERHRRVILTGLASFGAKGVTAITLLISVPLTIHYLGNERYGLWMTISSAVAILSFADLGIGNGLLNSISEAFGKDDSELAKQYVSSAFFILSGIATLIGTLFIVAYRFISWQKLFNITSTQAINDAGPSMAVFIGCFLLSIPLGVIQRIQMGYQEGFVNVVWQGAGNLLGLCSLFLAILLRKGLPWLVLAMAGSPVLATIINGIILFKFKRPWLLPAWCNVRLGLLFFILQVAVAIAYSSDNIVAAKVLGLSSVSEYSISMRIFSIAPIFLGMFLLPLWPAYGESITRGDIGWTRRTLVRSIKLSVLATGLPSLILIVFGQQIIKLWAGPEISPPFLLLLGLGIWTVLTAAGSAVAMFLNGCSIIGFQTITGILMAIAALIAKILLAKRLGLPGIIWGTVIAYIVFIVFPFTIYIPRMLAKLGPSSLKDE